MNHFIVIGNPIAHSKSPLLHQAFAEQTGVQLNYARQFCPNDKDAFFAVVDAFFNGGGVGANVTLPFKEWAFELCCECGELSDFARTAGAVNALSIKAGKLYGDNTDGRGLVADLTNKGIDLKDKNIAILGAGGATRGAILPLLNAGANISIFNRTLEKANNLIAEFNSPKLIANALDDLTGEFELIINATSAITNNQSLNLTDKKIKVNYAYDMAYGKDSEFLTHFNNNNNNNGAICYDGLGMLIHQGLIAFGEWNGVEIDTIHLDKVEALLRNG